MANHLLTVASGQRGVAVNQGRHIIDAGDQIVVSEEEYAALSGLIAKGTLIDGGTTASPPTYSTGGTGGGITSLTYDNAVTGTRFTVLYNGTAWPGSRPSARADIYFDLIGGSSAVADPAWMLNGDTRLQTGT